MKINKKNNLFKGLRKKTDPESPENLQERAVTESAEDAQSTESHMDFMNQPDKDIKKTEGKTDWIYHLYCKWCKDEKRMPEQIFDRWMKAPSEQTRMGDENVHLHTELFRKRLVLAADEILQKIEDAEAKKDVSEETGAEPLALDAAPCLYLTQDNQAAFLSVFPPIGDGEALSRDLLEETLSREGVTTGINNELLKRIAEEQRFFQIFPIAVGTPAVPGKDGEIIEHIPRKEVLSFEEDESGRVDFRELHLFRNIEEGDLICDIIEPQQGTDGIDVKGRILKAYNGKQAVVPAGNHTKMTSDGKKLVADMDGYISFQNGKFRVEKQLIINGNIDMSVGNQDFLGDIIVYGDVMSGFSLKATGNIYVKGFVEGAILKAGENIEITDGMNGSNCGELRAGGFIRSAFLENVKAYAVGDVTAKSMVSCEVRSHGSIKIDHQLGALIGGKITAGKSVTAKTIGSKAHRKTEIFLGMTPETRAEKDEKTIKLEETKKTRMDLVKNIRFLQTAKSLPEDKAAILKQLIEQEMLYGQLQKELEQEVAALNEMLSYQDCFVQSGTVHPPLKITIGTATYELDTTSTNCRFYLSKEGDIVLGTG